MELKQDPDLSAEKERVVPVTPTILDTEPTVIEIEVLKDECYSCKHLIPDAPNAENYQHFGCIRNPLLSG